nr:hypothetical protein [Nitrosomonas nitrosa]
MDKRATRIRRLVLGIALLATLLAVIGLEESDLELEEATVQPILPTRSDSANARSKKSDAGPLLVEQLGQRTFSAEADDIFAAASWEPKRPIASVSQSFFASRQNTPPPVAAPPPAPVAPPLQFKYVGKVIEGNRTSVFLSIAENNYVAKEGERIDANYRLDRIRDDVIEFTYLPLGIKQTLFINNDNRGRL